MNWTFDALNVFGIGRGISFRTQTEGWITTSFASEFEVTTDAGNRWHEVPAPNAAVLNEVNFLNERNGWAAGYNGALYKYNSSLIGISNNETIIPSNYLLYQNYPNPFNPSTIIKFDLMKSSDVTLKVFDVTGRVVFTLFNGFSIAGTHSNQFDAKNLASGIYIYQIIAKNHLNGAVDFTQFRKMVLLK